MTEITSRVMMSFTLPLCDLTYSPASWLVDAIISRHHERRRSVPVSARCNRSPSLTMPITLLSLSTMGTALDHQFCGCLDGCILVDCNYLTRHYVHSAHYNTSSLTHGH